MDQRAMKPQGLAILDYFNGDASAAYVMRSDDGETMNVPARIFFRRPAEWSTLERRAIDLCRGRVLDVGAGAGCHSLVLQERGLSVCAVDISPEAVQVMRQRGIREAHQADIFTFEAEPFDTLLMMMNGIGIVETLEGLTRFLKIVHRLLKPGGQILLDSFDARNDIEPESPEYWLPQSTPGSYYGEVKLRLGYKGHIGPPFCWLYVDKETLNAYSREHDWQCEIMHEEKEGAFLARLTRKMSYIKR